MCPVVFELHPPPNRSSWTRHPEVTLHIDSQFIVNGINRDLMNWIRRGWKKSDKKPVANTDLWKRYLTAAERHTVKAVHVQGHCGNKWNERVDWLSVVAIPV